MPAQALAPGKAQVPKHHEAEPPAGQTDDPGHEEIGVEGGRSLNQTVRRGGIDGPVSEDRSVNSTKRTVRRAGRRGGPSHPNQLARVSTPSIFQTPGPHVAVLYRWSIPDDADNTNGSKHVPPSFHGGPGREGPSSIPVFNDGCVGLCGTAGPDARAVEGHSRPGPRQNAPVWRIHLDGRVGTRLEPHDVLRERGQALLSFAPRPKALRNVRIGSHAPGPSLEFPSERPESVVNRSERRLDDRLLSGLRVGLDGPNGVGPNNDRHENGQSQSETNAPRPWMLSQCMGPAVHRTQRRRRVHRGSGRSS